MVNAHDKPRGLYLFDWLGSRRPRTTDKKKSPTFFYARKSEKNQKTYRLGDLGKINSKKYTYEKISFNINKRHIVVLLWE